MRIVYESVDGATFDTEKECLKREKMDVAPTKRMAKALKEHKVWEAGKELYKYIEELKEARQSVKNLP